MSMLLLTLSPIVNNLVLQLKLGTKSLTREKEKAPKATGISNCSLSNGCQINRLIANSSEIPSKGAPK